MSAKKLYILYDLQAESTMGQIIGSTRDAAAVRQFCELLANKETIVGQYPADFNLISIGELDETTGQITSGRPALIYSGKKWVNEQTGKVDDDNAKDLRLLQTQP